VDLREGTIVADRFTVQRRLGAGGSAVVYRAHDRLLDRVVALKLLAISTSPEEHSRFEREIRLTARLVHPTIIPLFDSGWHGDHLFYVMPCVTGDTLRVLLTARQRLPLAEALHLMSDVAEALAYAHASGFMHRDIKPENIFSSSGRALLADFGIARTIAPDVALTSVTSEGLAVGTVAYMSPEQALGDAAIDGRADLYSLGCVFLELLTGRPPFEGPSAMSVLAQHITAPIDVATRLGDGAGAPLVDLIARLLAKDPAARPATAGVVVEALRALAHLETTLSQADEVDPPAVAPARTPESETQRTIREARALYGRGVQGGDGAREALDMARALAERVLKSEPRNVVAIAVLADIVHCQGFRGFADEAEAYREAQRLRITGAAIDDNVGELQESIGVERLYWGDDFFGAERYLARGAALSPADSVAQRHYATWLKMAGRFDEALTHVDRAVALSPDSPHALVGQADILMAMGRYVEAIDPLRRALRLSPRYEPAMERLEMSCHRAGRFEEATDARRTLLGMRRSFERLERLTAAIGHVGWKAARAEDLRAELATHLATAGTADAFRDQGSSRQLSDRIIITAGELGDWTTAMDWVERSYFVRPGRLMRVLTDLPFDRRGLASDPRFARLLRTGGLEFLL
jgi:tetratricopeptide (TPR) repeat protein